MRAIKRLLVPQAVRPAAALARDGQLAREHLISYGADPERMWTFANTVDVPAVVARTDELRGRRDAIRHELGFAPDDVVVLQVGRLLPVKGADVLIDAAAEIGGVRLLLVGDGPERDRLESRARALGADPVFAGFRWSDKLLDAYVAADVFCLLSRRETWGVVVNEAAAAGLPLVLSDGVGAAADLLVDAENGVLVPAGDIAATRAALARLAGDAGLRSRYGARSRELVGQWGYEPSEAAFEQAVRAAVESRR